MGTPRKIVHVGVTTEEQARALQGILGQDNRADVYDRAITLLFEAVTLLGLTPLVGGVGDLQHDGLTLIVGPDRRPHLVPGGEDASA